MRKLQGAAYRRRVAGFDRPDLLFDAAERFCGARSHKATFKHWYGVDGHSEKSAVESIRDRVNALFAEADAGEAERPGRRLAAEWRNYRYGPAIRMVAGAVKAFADFRRKNGLLTFHDLLVLTVEMLERSPEARRSLGRRYRRLLVDEFQDTDPLQTRLVFLLASDPGEPVEIAWTALTPRPGALFVVGDPKQSIYRFRRADIALYEAVRRRFESFGRVVRLTANFRSGPAIERVVGGVFGPDEGGRFPAEPSDVQAAFAPLLTRPAASGRPDRVAFYRVPGGNRSEVQAWDARAVASWIDSRIADGERAPADFLILTRTKKGLDAYARELEARNLPVVVSGSGVGIEDELRELVTVLEALADPGDAVKTVAALEGLLFGCSPQQLLDHQRAGGRFDFRAGLSEGGGPVADALARMAGWWTSARDEPADQVVADIVEYAGLLPWAASGDLGSLKAGALAFALDLLRAATLSNDASLEGALEALKTVLDDDDTEVEAPLEPSRGGAIRLMNLHKAKGLEAKVVILADPSGKPPGGRSFVVTREPDGTSRGWIRVSEKFGRAWRTLAEPPGWDEVQAREERFEEAEGDRLLYVAITRAEEELVVATAENRPEGPWQALDPWLHEHAEELALAPVPRPERRTLGVSVDAVRELEAEVLADRTSASAPAWRIETVTRLVQQASDEADDEADDQAPQEGGGPAPGASDDEAGVDAGEHAGTPDPNWTQDLADSAGVGGTAWGNAVHATLEAALRGVSEGAIRLTARTALLENDRPVEDGEPVELSTLLALVDGLRQTDLWRRAEDAGQPLVEHPFLWDRGDGTIVEGVIDLAFREDAGWVLVDWKTAASDFAFDQRLPAYRAQIGVYAEAWSAITGDPVAETHVHRVGGAVG